MQKIPRVTAVYLHVVNNKPATLLIMALGIVPTGGWSGEHLVRYAYVRPPRDGYWQFDFLAVPPSGPAPEVLTPVATVFTWNDFPERSLKGVTVHGTENDVKMPVLAPAKFIPNFGGPIDPWPW